MDFDMTESISNAALRPLKRARLILLFAFPFLAPMFAQAADKPLNFVFIMADDLGQRDLGCYGSSFYETPNLDRFAQSGMRFTSAYAACPVCSPTRSSFQSGKYPARTRNTDFFGGPQPKEALTMPRYTKFNRKLLPAKYLERLPLIPDTPVKVFLPLRVPPKLNPPLRQQIIHQLRYGAVNPLHHLGKQRAFS